eukprot:515239-Hanusia_phi.AAC.1
MRGLSLRRNCALPVLGGDAGIRLVVVVISRGASRDRHAPCCVMKSNGFMPLNELYYNYYATEGAPT